jgi:CrcB protein
MMLVGIGAFAGANLRYAVSLWLARLFPTVSSWPFATLFANITGSMLLAVFLTWASRQLQVSDTLRLLVATGFFGSYTTFSTFANESVALAGAGRWWDAILYAALTNSLCCVGVLLGIWIGNRV